MADVSQIKLPNGSVYDLIDEKSGYITAEYIENKTDYEIPVSRVGEIVVGETAIGTDSTNFPTSKAVVDYVDERVVQEMDAIDVGVTSVNGKTGSVTLSASDVGAITQSELDDELTGFDIYLQNHIPTSTSQLTNDSGFITSETDPTVPAWAKASTKPTYTASEVGALPSNTVIPEDKVFIAIRGTTSLSDIFTAKDAGKVIFCKDGSQGVIWRFTGSSGSSTSGKATFERISGLDGAESMHSLKYLQLSRYLGQESWTIFTRTIPYRTSDLTNDSGYLTASDIASVMTYKGTKANYAALPASGNITGDVWHLTDTGAEWAWDGSAWQELGTAIDMSNYLTTSDIAAWAKASTKPTYTAAEVGAISTSHVVNGITSTDISNWNGKSDTDEKLSVTSNSTVGSYYLILDTGTSGVASKKTRDGFLKFARSSSTQGILSIGENGSAIGQLRLFTTSSGEYVTITPGTLTSIRTITLPDATGTVALTSDIPQVYNSSTNPNGYLTMATLPIYDGTVE